MERETVSVVRRSHLLRAPTKARSHFTFAKPQFATTHLLHTIPYTYTHTLSHPFFFHRFLDQQYALIQPR